ncbi:MAG: amidohydrolase family protein [Bacteroidales bacterium]
MKVYGQIVDINKRNIYSAVISILNNKIEKIERTKSSPEIYIMPSLIDSHMHIESSMVTPGAFAMTAAKHGTTGVVSDPHEIANVLGITSVEYMINDAKNVLLKFFSKPHLVCLQLNLKAMEQP